MEEELEARLEEWEKRCYAIVKKEGRLGIQAVKTETCGITVNPGEVVEAVKTWSHKMFDRDEEAFDVEGFMKEYGDLRPKVEGGFQSQKLAVEKVREQFREMKAGRVVAADGWRVREIKDLPDSLMAIAVELVSEVEQGRDLPELCVGWGLLPVYPKLMKRRMRRRIGRLMKLWLGMLERQGPSQILAHGVQRMIQLGMGL